MAARGGIVPKTAAKVATDEHTWEETGTGSLRHSVAETRKIRLSDLPSTICLTSLIVLCYYHALSSQSPVVQNRNDTRVENGRDAPNLVLKNQCIGHKEH